METNDASCNDMILKFKDSFSLKSFSTTSFRSSLICNSKTIRLDVNLIDGLALDSTKDCSASDYTVKITGRQSKLDTTSRHIQNLKNFKQKNKPVQISNFMKKKSAKKEKVAKSPEPENTFRSLSEDGKLNLKIPESNSRRRNSSRRNSLNPIQSRTKQNNTEFESLRCDTCMKYFSSKRNLKRHGVLHSSERHACQTCGKVFQTKENLKRHCRAIHETQVKSIGCSKCYKAFSRQLDLKIHLKKHPDHVQ